MNVKRVLIVAGEASGDAHGAALVRALSRLRPQWRFYGMGGERLRGVGVQCLYRLEDVSVVGLVEVASRARAVFSAFRGLRAALRERPDLVILIDFPDFNLRLAKYAHRLSIPVVYYVSPQVWAWRRWRLRLIRRVVDKMLVLFPFEAEIYRNVGVPVDYVGHPLIDEIPPPELCPTPRTEAERALSGPRIALLPGSRLSEVTLILPAFLEAARALRKSDPRATFLLVQASTFPPDVLQKRVDDAELNGTVECIANEKPWWNGVDLAWVASGTATLETALRGVPLIAAYRVRPLTYLIGRLLIRVSHISLVNLMASRRLVPELIQHDLTSAGLVRRTRELLADPVRLQIMRAGFREIWDCLAIDGTAAETAARAVLSVADTAEVSS
ncbi:MAG: lipid-A-disaccharide synthase [Candidatus Schekmanbacteria bacterium]|nr:lipid-A-disaccharide synthase [Candidatus Schekmanbacteria bacterium]